MGINIASLASGRVDVNETPILNASVAGSPSLVVRNIRFVNCGSTEVTLNLTLQGPQRFDPLPVTPTTITRQLLPAGTKIPAGALLVVDQEITLEAGKDTIKAICSAANVLDYVISGFQRSS